MADFPSSVSYATVIGIFASSQLDDGDVGDLPTRAPIIDLTVTLTPDVDKPLLREKTTPLLIHPEPITLVTNGDGVLINPITQATATKILATDDPDVEPVGWTWRVEIRSFAFGLLADFSIIAPSGTTIDLADAAHVASNPGVELADWQAAVTAALAARDEAAAQIPLAAAAGAAQVALAATEASAAAASATDAAAAAAAAEAVGDTNDAIIAGRIATPGSATDTALSAALAPKFSQIPGVGELAAMGDSITAHGNYAATSTVGPNMGGQSYLMWASILSDARLRYGTVAATSGYTAAQVRAVHLPTILAARPRYCVVLAGTNVGASPAQDRADLLYMWKALIHAGITPIVGTIPPQGTVGNSRTVAEVQNLNAWISATAQSLNLPIADFYDVLVDRSTGSVKAGVFYDVVHPNATGAKAMGQEITRVVGADLPLPPLARSNVWANMPNAVPTNALNYTFGAGRATGWAITGAGAAAAQVAMTEDEGLGYWQELTPGTEISALLFNGFLPAMAVGTRVAVGIRIKTSGMAATNSLLIVQLYGPGQIVRWFDFDHTDIELGTLWMEVDVLVATTTARIRIDAFDCKVSIGQITCVDLTAAGVST